MHAVPGSDRVRTSLSNRTELAAPKLPVQPTHRHAREALQRRAHTGRQPQCAETDGFSRHAAVRVEAHDRKRLEQLFRYITRPALSDERVQLNAAAQVEPKLKTPWRDGTTHLVMSPLEVMQRLAALMPRPRLRLVRLHGVLAPNARLRALVIPQGPPAENTRLALLVRRDRAPPITACGPHLPSELGSSVRFASWPASNTPTPRRRLRPSSDRFRIQYVTVIEDGCWPGPPVSCGARKLTVEPAVPRR